MQLPIRPIEAAPEILIVMGVSGCGKSTLGALLAERLQCPFLDADAFHDEAAIAKMSEGEPLNDDDRWPWLDRLGAAISLAGAEHGHVVAACSALRLAYRERLRGAIAYPARFVLLDNSREELLRRLNNRPGHFMPSSLLDSQLNILERPEAHEAATILDGAASPERLCSATLAWVGAMALGRPNPRAD